VRRVAGAGGTVHLPRSFRRSTDRTPGRRRQREHRPGVPTRPIAQRHSAANSHPTATKTIGERRCRFVSPGRACVCEHCRATTVGGLGPWGRHLETGGTHATTGQERQKRLWQRGPSSSVFAVEEAIDKLEMTREIASDGRADTDGYDCVRVRTDPGRRQRGWTGTRPADLSTDQRGTAPVSVGHERTPHRGQTTHG
jgi:hypothetical protein